MQKKIVLLRADCYVTNDKKFSTERQQLIKLMSGIQKDLHMFRRWTAKSELISIAKNAENSKRQ